MVDIVGGLVVVRFKRDEDVALCRKLQNCISYFLKCLNDYLRKNFGQTLPVRKIGHKAILLEQIWRGRASSVMETLWTKTLRQEKELSLENLVEFLAQYYPQVRKKFREFQEVSSILMERHFGLALSLAHKIAEEVYHVDEEDLVGEAVLAVISAALRYKPSHQTNFSTYAYYVIRSMLLDYASRAQKGISFSPSVYVKMKKEDSRISVLSFSEIEEEDEDGDISQTGDEVANGIIYQYASVDDMLAEVEVLDVIGKFPPPFDEIAMLLWRGDIENCEDLKLWGIPSDLATKMWEVMGRLVSKYVLVV